MTLASDAQLDLFDMRVDEQYRVLAACDHAGDLEWNEQIFAAAPSANSAGVVVMLPLNDNGTVSLSVPHNATSKPVNTLTLAQDGVFFTGGQASASVTVPGAGTLDNNGCQDAIVIGSNGPAAQVTQSIGGSGCEKIDNLAFGTHMATDANGNLLVCGTFENGAVIGLNVLTGNGLWVARINTGIVATQQPVLQEINVRPNPAGETVQLSFPENASGRCRILSLTGKSMSEMAVQPLLSVSVSTWPAGLYLVEYQDEQGSAAVGKMLVQH